MASQREDSGLKRNRGGLTSTLGPRSPKMTLHLQALLCPIHFTYAHESNSSGIFQTLARHGFSNSNNLLIEFSSVIPGQLANFLMAFLQVTWNLSRLPRQELDLPRRINFLQIRRITSRRRPSSYALKHHIFSSVTFGGRLGPAMVLEQVC